MFWTYLCKTVACIVDGPLAGLVITRLEGKNCFVEVAFICVHGELCVCWCAECRKISILFFFENFKRESHFWSSKNGTKVLYSKLAEAFVLQKA